MNRHLSWALPLFFLALLSPFTPWLDLEISRAFFSSEGFVDNHFTRLMFRYGELFGLAVGFVALGVYALSWVLPRWRVWRRGALALVLSIALGAGVITNCVLKGYWGRPRPKQIVEFGGTHLFRPFWRPDFHATKDPQKSFPSGHTAVGFYYTSHILVGRRYRLPWLFYGGLFLTGFLGIGLMLTRLMMGGHFLSDTLFAAAIMWLTALVIDRFLFTWEESRVLGPLPEHLDTSREPALQ